MSTESAPSEQTPPPRVQLNPTVDPEHDRPIPSIVPELAEAAPVVEEIVESIVQDPGPLAETIRTGEAVEIPAVTKQLEPELEAEIAAAMAGVENLALGAGDPTPSAAGSSSSAPATAPNAVPAEFNPEEVTPGMRLSGKVVTVYGDSVILDIQGRASAAVPVKNFDAAKIPAVGVTLALVVEQYDAAEGLIRARVASGGGVSKPQGNWDAVAAGQVVDCLVVKTNKGGLEVSVSNLRGFMPAAQIDMAYCANLEQFVGQKLRAEILEVNPQKKNLILSRKKFLESTLVETRDAAWANLAVGQKVVGKVKSLKDYGAFIDVGGIDGLLHVSEITWNRLNHPRELLKEGQEVEVLIVSMDREKMKIGLGMKQLSSSPWLAAMENYPIDSTVHGKVTKVTEFGAFVELEPGIEGMIHISELDHKRVVRVTDVLQVGKEVDLKVLKIEPNKKRIALSLKALKEKPEGPKKVADEDLAPSANAPAYKPRNRNPLRGGGTGSGGLTFGRPDRD